MELRELGTTIRTAREASGISQGQLARMAGISRATVNYAEQGRSAVGADALLRLLSPLGLAITPMSAPDRAAGSGVGMLASGASVSFSEAIPASEVERAFVTGTFDDRWLPHVATLVDEASDATLLRAIREVAATHSVSPSMVWRHLRSIASALASPHPRWA